MRRLAAFANLLLAVCIASTASAEEISALLQRTLDAYGGVELLSKVVAVRQRGEVHPKRRHVGEVAALLRLFQGAEQLRVEIAYSGGAPEVRVLDGPQGWRDAVAVSGPLRDSMAIQAARLALPLLLHERADALIDRGSVPGGGAARRKLELPLAGASSLLVEIDSESGRILRSVGRLSMGAGGAMEFVTEYSDFRKVGGVLFAFRERNFAGGMVTAETVLDTVELLDAAPSGAFAP